MGAYQLFFLSRVPAFAAVNEAVDGARAAGGAKVAAFANAILRALSREASNEKVSVEEAIVASAAPWLKASLARALGEDAVAPFLASGAETPPLGIRVATPDARDPWIARLREALPDASFEPGRVSPLAIRALGAGKPQALPGWSLGDWTVQEEGSQLVALALGAREGEVVLDVCAGRGNKTSALATIVGPRGAVDAADVHAPKLEALTRELTRLKLSVRAKYAVDWSVGSSDVPRDFDRVLVDAPLGRRHPPAPPDLRDAPDGRRPRCARELADGDPLARFGGTSAAAAHLVYAVCSVLREEAEDVVASFLAAHPDFAAVPFDSAPARATVASPEASSLRLLPHVHGTDGYFLSSLQRLP